LDCLRGFCFALVRKLTQNTKTRTTDHGGMGIGDLDLAMDLAGDVDETKDKKRKY
jgi:hypothetical protein